MLTTELEYLFSTLVNDGQQSLQSAPFDGRRWRRQPALTLQIGVHVGQRGKQAAEMLAGSLAGTRPEAIEIARRKERRGGDHRDAHRAILVGAGAPGRVSFDPQREAQLYVPLAQQLQGRPRVNQAWEQLFGRLELRSMHAAARPLVHGRMPKVQHFVVEHVLDGQARHGVPV